MASATSLTQIGLSVGDTFTSEGRVRTVVRVLNATLGRYVWSDPSGPQAYLESVKASVDGAAEFRPGDGTGSYWFDIPNRPNNNQVALRFTLKRTDGGPDLVCRETLDTLIKVRDIPNAGDNPLSVADNPHGLIWQLADVLGNKRFAKPIWGGKWQNIYPRWNGNVLTRIGLDVFNIGAYTWVDVAIEYDSPIVHRLSLAEMLDKTGATPGIIDAKTANDWLNTSIASGNDRIETIQAGLGTPVAIESYPDSKNVHINSATGAITYNVAAVSDGTWHYVMNVGTENSNVTISGAAGVFYRNGTASDTIVGGAVPVAAGQTLFIHVTNNAGSRFVNIARLGSSAASGVPCPVWIANDSITLGMMRQRITPDSTVLELVRTSPAPRTTNATWDVAEAGQWSLVGQSAVNPFVANAVLPFGYRIRESGAVYQHMSARKTQGFFNSTEKPFWQLEYDKESVIEKAVNETAEAGFFNIYPNGTTPAQIKSPTEIDGKEYSTGTMSADGTQIENFNRYIGRAGVWVKQVSAAGTAASTAINFAAELSFQCTNTWTARTAGTLPEFDAPDASNHYRAKRDMVIDVSSTCLTSEGGGITVGMAVQYMRSGAWVDAFTNTTGTTSGSTVVPFHASSQIFLKAGDYLRFLTNCNNGGGNSYPGSRNFRIAIIETPTLTLLPANSTVLSPRAITGSGTGTGYDGVPVPVRINVPAGQGLLTVSATGGANVSGIDPLSNTCLVTANGADAVLTHTSAARSTFTGLQRVGRYKPTTAIDINDTVVETGIDMRTAKWLVITLRDNTTSTFDGVTDTRQWQTIWIDLEYARASGNIFYAQDYDNGYIQGRVRNTTTGQMFFNDQVRGMQVVEISVYDEAANGYVIPTGFQPLTPRSITGSLTAQGFDNLEVLYLIPLAANTALDTVSPANIRIVNAYTGQVAIKPSGGDVAVTHTTRAVPANLSDFTNPGGDTALTVIIPNRPNALLDEIRFTFKDRRMTTRNNSIVIPVSYFQPISNNGWTYWRDGNFDVIWKDITNPDSSVYRLHVYFTIVPQGLRLYFTDSHSNASSTYGAVIDIVGKFR